MVFSVMTKNLNWEISTKNFVTFKRWDSVNDEKFKYYGSSLKDPIFFFFFLMGVGQVGVGGGEGVNHLKRGAWIFCRFKKGLG